MGERMPERAMEASALVEHDGDRTFAVVALVVCALSGFVVGLLVQGGVAHSLLTAVMIAPAGWIGWWLRGVL